MAKIGSCCKLVNNCGRSVDVFSDDTTSLKMEHSTKGYSTHLTGFGKLIEKDHNALLRVTGSDAYNVIPTNRMPGTVKKNFQYLRMFSNQLPTIGKNPLPNPFNMGSFQNG